MFHKTISKNFIKLATTSALISGVILSSVDTLQAAGLQVLTSYTYLNPAEMDYVDNFKFSIGGAFLNVNGKFTGTFNGVQGSSKTNRNTVLPYGQIVYRIPCHKKLVIGFDVSNPQYANLKYKSGTLSGIQSEVISRNFSPKVSYQVLEKLTLGIGLDILYNQKSIVNFPTGPAGVQRNKVHGSTFGWDAGFLWKVAQTSFISGSYHSKMFVQAHGFSSLPNNPTTFASANANIPDTFSLNYLQILSKEWLVNFTARYALWKKAYKAFIIRNAAGFGAGSQTEVFPLNYKNSWIGQFFTRYQFAEKWAGIGFVEYDSNPQPKRFRPVSFPTDQLWFFGLGLQYEFMKNMEAQLVYGYGFLNPKFANATTIGKEKLNVNLVDLRLTYKF